MEELLIFLFSLVLAWVGLPLLQAIGELLLTAIDAIRVKLSISISKSNAQIQKIQDSMEPAYSSAIGFEAPREYNDEWEVESEPEDKAIGFKAT